MVARPNWCSTVVWRKSRFSAGQGDCVEIARLGDIVLFRDSHDRYGDVLAITPAEWGRLAGRIQSDELDVT
ncbi:DUF397 domain-containing protein [Actinomadura rudentiformis]|uniref:DUF397 domain-containing protein n=1 Tax=Actinomadura rudentiformis TaxID=359158 RepID=A0A6H9YGG4_9ACTN|nr:DUF397 domain-containing protein [Actinomadura rudentiformis]KAB2339350.1 DUF397 domain-containing protein [Actinomadura rudentiformis]